MATGDSTDILARIKRVVPSKWWGFVAPLRDAVFGGVSDALASVYSFISYTKIQTRIASATDFWLDLAALDYFARRIRRHVNEADPDFSLRIRKEIVRERATRKGMIEALTDLTGRSPSVFEPWNTGDCGGYYTPYSGYCGLAYNEDGAYGSQAPDNRAAAWITAYRSGGGGTPGVAGYNDPTGIGAYGSGLIDYSAPPDFGATEDQDIIDCVNMTKPEGVNVILTIID